MNEVKDYTPQGRLPLRPVTREAILAETERIVKEWDEQGKDPKLKFNGWLKSCVADLLIYSVASRLLVRQHSGELWEHVTELSTKLAAAEARIAGLESRPAGAGVKWAGVHINGRRYGEGDLCTRGGSLWLAKNATTESPGPSASWTLICKRGDHDRR